MNGYYNGIRTLVPLSEHTPENRYNVTLPLELIDPKVAKKLPSMPPLDPVVFNPYPNYDSFEYIQKYGKVEKCYLDPISNKILAPDVYAYPGIPQNMTQPFFGSYKELGMNENVCFERYGRLGPYGYGYNRSQGGLGPGSEAERVGSEKVFGQAGIIDYSHMNWGDAQATCYEKNKARFEKPKDATRKVDRHAYILRIWTGFQWNDHQLYTMRAMINELSLKSGGEYDVHFLLHVKDNSIPIWASQEKYRQTVEKNMPKEFWSMTTLWSEAQIKTYYPNPFPDNVDNDSGQPIHGVYRSAHFALQWFSQQHQEYDFFWNWEMDLRFLGHYYEFNTALGDWARNQPRKGMWERNERFYIPALHGTWQNFTEIVETETRDAGKIPIWGPEKFENNGMVQTPPETTPPHSYDKDNYEWGVGEDADLITFNPIFDVAKTNWVFRFDVTGYTLSKPVPPRRTAIITVSRLSKRLLNIMHEETWHYKHTMFPEMWPPSVALHHGLKAVYAPHPVYFDRDWDLEHMDQVFNHPHEEWESPFGWGEHNFMGSSFYYNSHFSGALWRRWLGLRENNEGGRRFEEENSGRMCLRPVLHHPIKHEVGESH